MRPNDEEIVSILETASKSFFASDLTPVLQKITDTASLRELDKIPYAINLFCSRITVTYSFVSNYLYATVPALILNHYWNRVLPADLYNKMLSKYLEGTWRQEIIEAAHIGSLSYKVEEIERTLHAR